MPALELPTGLSGYKPSDVGVLTHALIAGLLPHVRALDRFALPERVHDLAASLVSGRNINRRRSLQLVAAQHACTYLRRAALPPPWELAGAEFDTGSGRVDVAWRDTRDDCWLYDEVKTMNRPLTAVDPVWMPQLTRYLAAGADRHRERFLGVRLVPLGSLHLTGLLSRDGWQPITLSAADLPGSGS